MKKLLGIIVVLLSLVLLSQIPFPVPANLDFQVLYFADQGVAHGIPLYDHENQTVFFADQMGVSTDQVFVLHFPYPPWYAISTLFLTFFSVEAAARLWFLLNMTMLFLSVWLLTDQWTMRSRLYIIFASSLFLPVLGSLVVGQYVFPTFLGMALLIHALKNKSPWQVAMGMALLTYKPHIGLIILIVGMCYLFMLKNQFGRSAIFATLVAGVLLFAIGFLADAAWPISYLRSLLGFSTEISECSICVGLPLKIANLIGLGFSQIGLISLFLFVVLTALVLIPLKNIPVEEVEAASLIAKFICVILLTEPYLLSYDFSFALIPWIVLIGTASSKTDWLWIVVVSVLPWIFLGIFEREGNIVLTIIVLILFFVLLTSRYTQHKMVQVK